VSPAPLYRRTDACQASAPELRCLGLKRLDLILGTLHLLGGYRNRVPALRTRTNTRKCGGTGFSVSPHFGQLHSLHSHRWFLGLQILLRVGGHPYPLSPHYFQFHTGFWSGGTLTTTHITREHCKVPIDLGALLLGVWFNSSLTSPLAIKRWSAFLIATTEPPH
jgi:hypothetical protein